MSVELWQKLQEALAELVAVKEECRALNVTLKRCDERIAALEAKSSKTLTVPKK
jgi:hypothetical protein